MPSLLAHYGLFMVAAIIYAGEIGLPTLIPGEIALLFAGSQFIHSPLALIAAIALFGTVDILATSTIHLASRSGGNRLLCRLIKRLKKGDEPPEKMIDQWRGRLGGRDSLVVFVTRLIPMFRLYASITTGLIRIRLRNFFLGAGPAAWLWATTPLTIGFLFRHQIGTNSSQYGLLLNRIVMLSVSVTLMVAFCAWLLRADSRTAALRRLRLVVGLAAFLAAFARLVALAITGAGSAAHQTVLSIPVVPVRVLVITGAALALLWIFSHDLREFRTTRRIPRAAGLVSTGIWFGMTGVVAYMLAATGVHAPML